MKHTRVSATGLLLFIRYCILLFSYMATMIFFSCTTSGPLVEIDHTGANTAMVRITNPQKLLLLPIQESADEAVLQIRSGEELIQTLDVRLAVNRIDYCVPFELDMRDSSGNLIKELNIGISGVDRNAICWREMKPAETFDMGNREYFRPVYHHTPLYGWMNDPNGLVYKDGEYHLYYQYNPYGSLWGNMHWGHSTSKDLIHWQHHSPVIARDTLGHIFSGSSVVDSGNTLGYGAGNIVAFYTSSSDENGQIQCMAYSNDNGYSFTKYEGNPVLRPFDGLKDFRDPKVFWYAPEEKWVMIVSADKEMRFYSSKNLIDWTYLSAWGEGYGVQPSQFECPDMFRLPVNGDVDNQKWVMIVNVNPGCYFGGSATQYFVGDFDGTTFICDTPKERVKWLDWGKDHYAAVCFSNTGDRVIAVPWMSNWQYANQVPTMQYRSANALPRELALYSDNGELYVSAAPVEEVKALRGDRKEVPSFTVNTDYHIDKLLDNNEGAYELEIHFTDIQADVLGFKLFNEKGQEVDIYFNTFEDRLVMDRTRSGITDFGCRSVPHALEPEGKRMEASVNYINDFALGTWGPVGNMSEHTVNVFVDKCSVEIFVDNGRLAMTNLIFPDVPYNRMSFYSKGGSYKVDSCTVYKLEL